MHHLQRPPHHLTNAQFDPYLLCLPKATHWPSMTKTLIEDYHSSLTAKLPQLDTDKTDFFDISD